MDVYLLGLAVGLGYHCYTDVRYMLLYDSTNIVLAVLALLRAWQLDCLNAVWQGAIVMGGLMLIIYYASRGGMGEGDVKLAAVLGLWLGVEQGLLCLLLACSSSTTSCFSKRLSRCHLQRSFLKLRHNLSCLSITKPPYHSKI